MSKVLSNIKHSIGILSCSLIACSYLVGCGGGSSQQSSGGGSNNNQNNGTYTWIGGSNSIDQSGTYGTQGTPSSSNIPGGRMSSASWIDNSGNLWMFGGQGSGLTTGSFGFLNDLWKYSIANKTWTWMGGSNIINQPGIYGTQGTPSSSNIPGGRTNPASWIDNSGNLWMFGGYGYAATTGGFKYLNDLWKYNIANNTWTWMGGSNSGNQNGVYGTQGTPSTSNIPGGRHSVASWIDASGNLWLLGGNGYDATNNINGYLNDMWKYNITNNTWTWVNGSSTFAQGTVYGTQGVPSTSNIVGGRYSSNIWIDKSGNLWLFGGFGCTDTCATSGNLNDLWKYNFTNNTWTWISGSKFISQMGIYGTQGVASTSNAPGSRANSLVDWIDKSGNLWMFGGQGYGSVNAQGMLNDIWKYNITNNTWTWMSGSSLIAQPTAYGSPGVPSTNNIVGGRSNVANWIDNSGNLWMFGGRGYATSSTAGYLNDFWIYQFGNS